MVPLQEREIQITRPASGAHAAILTEEATRFLAKLANKFEDTRQRLLAMRRVRQQEIDAGKDAGISYQTQRRFARPSGRWPPFRATSSIGASKSPAPWTGR